MATQDKSRIQWTGKSCCAAKWCCNRNSADISLSRFPIDDRLEDWVAYANRPEFLNWPSKKVHEQRLCSEHFLSTDFLGASRRLKYNAVPSVPVTNRYLRPLVPPAFFLDPSKIARAKADKAAGDKSAQRSPETDTELEGRGSQDDNTADDGEPTAKRIIHRNVYITAGGSTKFKDKVMNLPPSKRRKAAQIREITSSREPVVEEERVPSPLELPLFPDDLFSGVTCEEIDMLEDVNDLGMDLASDYDEPDEPKMKSVGQQTEHSSMGISEFTTFLCSLSNDGAGTQVSHGHAEHLCDVAEGPTEWLISYLVY